jgi:hypothetical protein
MDALSTILVAPWVLMWLAVVGIAAPAVALGPAAGRRMLLSEPGPALVWTWLTMAVSVPLLSALRGFNWATALLVVAAWPTAWWLIRYRGRYESTFRDTVRGIVYRAVSPHAVAAPPLRLGAGGLLILAMPILGLASRLERTTDIRLPMALDFDTLWHTRQLVHNAAVWDPLAALAGVLAGISAADALHVVAGLRVALVTLTAAAAAVLVAETSRRWWIAGATAAAVILMAPQAAAHSWAVALVALVGATSLVLWIRDDSPRDGWHAMAALLLGAGLVVPFSDRLDALVRVTTMPQYLEHRAAALEAVRLARTQPDDDWVAIGPPELGLEIGVADRYLDLARFVSRFQHRAHRPGFRFNLGARRLFVFIEKEPSEPAAAVQRVRFVEGQSAVYRVRRERIRLHQSAWRICDEYRRTHGRTTIVYDDVQLRIYRIDL